MAITVQSPHNGRPVKIRPEDVGRAVRDSEGKIFYVLPREDGRGHFGSLTRQGASEKEVQCAELTAKAVGEHDADDSAYDATGRSGFRSLLFPISIILAILIILILLWLFMRLPPDPIVA